jgi:hypothetical protein
MLFKRFLRRARTEFRNTVEGAPYALGAIFLAVEGIREMRDSDGR